MKKNIFKLNKLKIKLLALFVSVIFILGAATDVSLADSTTINVDKKVISYDEAANKYKIELSVTGTPVEKENLGDIVLCIDTSGSMNEEIGEGADKHTRLDKVKEAVLNFCNTLKDETTGNFIKGVRVGICEFNHINDSDATITMRNDYIKVDNNYYRAGNAPKGSSKDAKIICNFTNDISTIRNSINNLNNKTGAGTNTEAGIECAGSMFENNDVKKFVVLYTDGLPTISNNHGYGKSYVDTYLKSRRNYILSQSGVEALAYYRYNAWQRYFEGHYNDIHFSGAQTAYNKLLGGINQVGGIAAGGIAKPAQLVTPKYTSGELKFYTIADTTDISKIDDTLTTHTLPYDKYSEYGMLYRFLNTLNNTGGFKDVNDSNVSKVYNEIGNSIKSQIISNIAQDAVIKDVIPAEFELPSTEEITKQFSSQLQNGAIESININSSTREITFKIGNIGGDGLKLVYELKTSNDYFYGVDVPTNKSAVLNYTDPANNEKASKEFPVPKVDIAAKLGNIKIEKKSVDSNGQWINAEDPDEMYHVLLQGNDNKTNNTKCSYNFKLESEPTANVEEKLQSMDFIMKDADTDINTAEGFINNFLNSSNASAQPEKYEACLRWSKLGWVGVGTYSISEVVPINYVLHSIEVYYSSDGNNYVLNTEDSNNHLLTIDPEHKYVKVIINNEKVNNNYWWAKDNEPNIYEPAANVD